MINLRTKNISALVLQKKRNVFILLRFSTITSSQYVCNKLVGYLRISCIVFIKLCLQQQHEKAIWTLFVFVYSFVLVVSNWSMTKRNSFLQNLYFYSGPNIFESIRILRNFETWQLWRNYELFSCLKSTTYLLSKQSMKQFLRRFAQANSQWFCNLLIKSMQVNHDKNKHRNKTN